ncbi:MAG: hypothetical protein E7443_02805 [Ruminococcaceae bacterium]|nr:hypothetical protein [Oscillospiraceae bacterium]
MKHNKILKALFSVTGVILLSKLLGFVKQMVTAGVFGATIETDLIHLSEGFVGNIKYVLVQTLLTAFVAVYLHTKEEDDGAARRFAADTGRAFTAITAVMVAVVMLFAPQIARIIAPSYPAELTARLAMYLRIFSPALVLFVWIAVFHALLNANQRFIPGELEGANQSLILLALVAGLASVLGVRILVVAFLAAAVWNALFLGVVSRRYWEAARSNPFRNPAVKELLRMTGPLLLGYAMVYINQQVGNILVSGLEAGTVTAMDYAAVLFNLVGTLIGSFCSILFTYITKKISQKDHESAARLTLRAAVLLVAVFLPISILMILCAEDIVTIVYGRGAFAADNIRVAADALVGFSLGVVPLVVRDLFSRVQYAYQDSKQPMINSTVSIAVNIGLSVALCPVLGVLGVSMAGSVSLLVCGGLNLITARRHNAFLRYGELLKCLPWLCVGSVVCLLTARWSIGCWQTQGALLRFALVTLTAGGAYALSVSPLLLRLLRKENEPAA